MIDQQLRQTVLVKNPLGFHVRPITLFVTAAQKYQCEVTVSKGKQRADGRRVIDLISLCALKGTELTIEVSGPDAAEALPVLVELVQSTTDPTE